MREIRERCERCGRALPPDSPEAYWCGYGCTWCGDCVDDLAGRCPNCGGELVPRPARAGSGAGPVEV